MRLDFSVSCFSYFSSFQVHERSVKLFFARCVSFTRYVILLKGGLFEYVTCPHYLGECIEWLGFAVATQTTGGAAFAFWTFANLFPRAVAYRAWHVSPQSPQFHAFGNTIVNVFS